MNTNNHNKANEIKHNKHSQTLRRCSNGGDRDSSGGGDNSSGGGGGSGVNPDKSKSNTKLLNLSSFH